MWQVPHDAVYGIGIARPGATPLTATFVFNGTSKTWDFNGPSQYALVSSSCAFAKGGVLIILPKPPEMPPVFAVPGM